MMPIGDDDTDRRSTPLLNYLLIAINVLVFVVLQGMGSNDRFTYAFATVPAEIVTGRDVNKTVTITDPASGEQVGTIRLERTPSVYLTLLTSMFMHGGFAHLFGNMLYLWIFGDNLEDLLGRTRYLIFYLLTGLIASLSHVFATSLFHGNMFIPSLGASGAISGVLAGYLVLFPNRRVRVLLGRMVTQVPAIVAIGLWFAFQLINGLGVFGSASQSGGVAYAAHIGGFIAGLILIKPFAMGRSTRPRLV